MSLILDALKRAENERGAQAATGLPELSPVSLAEPASQLRRVLIGVTLALVAGIVLWRYFASKPRAAEPAAVAAVEQRPADTIVPLRPEPAPPPAKKTGTQPAAPAKPIAGTEEVASFEEVTGPEDTSQAETAAATSAPAAQTIPAAAAAPATPAPAAAAPQPQTTAAPQNRSPVRLIDTSPAYRAAFPVFTIQVHSWDAKPSLRFVRIDGYRYAEGDALPKGPTIVEITANGLVLDWQGERVIYPLN